MLLHVTLKLAVSMVSRVCALRCYGVELSTRDPDTFQSNSVPVMNMLSRLWCHDDTKAHVFAAGDCTH